ncbi:thioredoxin family protein [Patescibacteria group bacterium]|nr:thioredoxin family protein [Patescibacteria group bacterium]MBU1970162.1 thioredoxin family protein [Patescibacteria group bacterium]
MKVLKFGAVWCPGCLVMKPRWQEIEKENPWLETRYFEYDEAQDMVNKWQVGTVLPVFIFLTKDDQEITRLVGEVSKEELLKIIQKHQDS